MRWIALFLLPGLCFGRTLFVPDSFATIQAALDSTRDGDTVLVALGTYAEALHAPGHGFVLRGDVVPDTGDYPRPVLDISSLPRCDTLRLMTLSPRTSLTAEDFYFRNGPEVYQGAVIPDQHGFAESATSLTFRRCIFDSVSDAIYTFYSSASITVLDCRFLHCPHNCIAAPLSNIQAFHC
jgi:hypothetical protein